MVIAFVEEEIARRNGEVDEKRDAAKEKKEEADKIDRLELTRPYADYEDFLDRTLTGGGFFIAEREEDESNGTAVTRYEVKLEKLARTGPKRITTWVFHAPGVDFAVQVEVLEEQVSKLQGSIRSSLRSFKLIERSEGELPGAARAADSDFISISAMNSGTLAERTARRQESERRLHERARASLPSDWSEEESETALVLYDSDSKYAERVAEHCESMFEWLEDNLGFIGPDEYVRKPIVRVCDSEAEKDSLARGARNSGGWWFSSNTEIVTCKSDTGWSGWEMNWVNQRLFDLWLRERDAQLWIALPKWIDHGLNDYLGGARQTGRKLKFKDYQRDLVDYKVARSKGQTLSARDLVQLTSGEFYANAGGGLDVWNRMAQSDTFVRFLLSPEGSRNRLTRTLLADYLNNLRKVITEIETEDLASSEESPKEARTEEEEEELYRKRHERWKGSERERQIIQRTFTRTFGAWSERDWSLLEKAFETYTG
jgi:hypothetical protein